MSGFHNSEYYIAFKDILGNAKQWMEQEGLDQVSYHDVAIFRVGHRIGEIEDAKVAAIAGSKVRAVCERDYCVEFTKMTKKMPDRRVKTYTYKMSYTAAGMIRDGKPLFKQGGKCRYMPEGWTIPVGDAMNDTGEEIRVGRETTGKYVCDQVDKSRVPTLASNVWVPSIQYTGEKPTLPVAKDTVDMDTNVVQSLSLLAKVANGVYKNTVGNEGEKFNGVVVTPVLMIYEQIRNAYEIAIAEVG